MGKWNRVCCYCNQPIEERAFKDRKCPNDGVVFWIHPHCYLRKTMTQNLERK